MDSFMHHQESTVNLSDLESTNIHDASAAPDSGGLEIVKVAGKSIKEIEDQLNGLRKENFNLKLRIFFLEENINPGFDIEETVKTNVNLKMEVSSLKHELDLTKSAKRFEKEEHRKYKKEMEKNLMELNQKLNNQDFLIKMEEYKSIISEQTVQLDRYETEIQERDDKISTLESLLKTMSVNKDISEASASSISLRRSPLKSLSSPNGSETIKFAELEKKHLKACHVIQTLFEGRKKDQVEAENLKKKLKMKDEEIKNLKKLKEVENMSTNVEKKIDESIDGDPMELLGQYKELAEELDNEKQILLDTLKERDGQMLTLEEHVSSLLNELETQGNRIEELEFELLGKENREKSDSGTEKDEKCKEIERLEKELNRKTSDLQTVVNKELWEKNREIEKLQNKFTMFIEEKEVEISNLKKVKDEYVKYKYETDAEIKELMMKGKCADFESKNEHIKLYSELKQNDVHSKHSEPKKNNDGLNLFTEDHKKLLTHIEELKIKLIKSDENLRESETLRSETNEICSALGTRLEELALFLDSLLRQKSVLGFLGNNKNNRLKRMINQSLDLSRSLNMSLSMNPDQSLMQLTNISELLESTRADSICAEQFLDNEKYEECSRSSLFPEQPSITYRNCMDAKNAEKMADQAEIIKDLRAQVTILERKVESQDEKDLVKKLMRSGEGEIIRTSVDMDSKSHLFSPEKVVENPMTLNVTKNLHQNMSETLPESNQSENRSLENVETTLDKTTNTELDTLDKTTNTELNTQSTENNEGKTHLEVISKKYTEIEERLSEAEDKRKIAEDEKRSSDEERVILQEQIEQFRDLVEELEENKRMLSDTVEANLKIIQSLECELSETLEGKEIVEEELMLTQEGLRLAEEKVAAAKIEILEVENRAKKAFEEKIKMEEDFQKKFKSLQTEMTAELESLQEREINLKIQLEESECDYLEKIGELRKDLDEAVVHYSEIVFQKNRVEDENGKLEKDLCIQVEKEKGFVEEISNYKEVIEKLQLELNKRDIKANLCEKCKNFNDFERKNSEFNEFASLQENSDDFDCINRSVNFERRQRNSSDCNERGNFERRHLNAPDLTLERRASNSPDLLHLPRRGMNSPDLGIESDNRRFSSLEGNNTRTSDLSESEKNCCDKAEENNRLKRKLDKSEKLLRETLKKLARANERKREVERNICSQISKTSQVLKKVKANLDSGSERDDQK